MSFIIRIHTWYSRTHARSEFCWSHYRMTGSVCGSETADYWLRCPGELCVHSTGSLGGSVTHDMREPSYWQQLSITSPPQRPVSSPLMHRLKAPTDACIPLSPLIIYTDERRWCSRLFQYQNHWFYYLLSECRCSISTLFINTLRPSIRLVLVSKNCLVA